MADSDRTVSVNVMLTQEEARALRGLLRDLDRNMIDQLTNSPAAASAAERATMTIAADLREQGC